MASETRTIVTGFRRGDRRPTAPKAWYATDRCGSCGHPVWADEAKRGEGREVRCTVCLAAEGIRTAGSGD